jgi:hypothetical protein
MTIKKAKVTKIQKHYKDKRTGEEKFVEIEYSKVADRLIEFRQDCPKGDIKNSIRIENGYIFAEAVIKKDKKDPNSAEANGHAIAKVTGYEKEFEKLQTLAVGRALAFLGYLAGGEIASSEEMEEFQSYKEQQRLQAIEELKSKVDEIKDKNSLREFYRLNRGYGVELDEYITNKSKQLA